MRGLWEKRNIYWFIEIIIFIGILVPFACQFVIPLFVEAKDISGVEVWNQFVSMILGIVATILSIVSLKMGFDSAESARNTELKTQSVLDGIEEKICILSERQEQMVISINEMRNNKDNISDVQSHLTNWNKKTMENKEI